MRYLLDTNTCIYIIKRSPPQVLERFNNLNIGDIGISAISFCELQFGISNSSKPEQNQLALTKFISPLEILDFPSSAAPLFGKIRSQLKSAGTPIGNYDLLIAAHALHLGLTLVSNNLKEFRRIPDLETENWISPPHSA